VISRRQCLHGLVSLPWLLAGVRAAAAGNRLSVVGSDTLAPLCLAWLNQLQTRLPGLQVRFQASGSATAAQALIEGAADLGPMSRRMTADELGAFRARHGYEPTPVVVALDAIAVVVHPDNPLRQAPLAAVDAIYSTTRWCAPQESIRRWGQLGLVGEWKRSRIVPYGRNTISGTFEYFRQQALCGGDFRPDMGQMLASAAVLRAVSGQPRAIGFVGAGYLDDSVRALALIDAAGRAAGPDPAAVVDGRYALARPLLIYVVKSTEARLQPAVAAFLDLALSEVGQQQAPQAGLIALPAERLQREREKLAEATRR
jgi:phosphate transport system substrate-binding protein